MELKPSEIQLEKICREIRANVERARERIARAAARSGRSSDEILLVAVSKYATPQDGVVEGLLRAGVFDLAENRQQRLNEKTDVWTRSPYWNGDALAFHSPSDPQDATIGRLRWHFIGPLQRNKIRKILPYVSLIHSVDSLKLLEAIERILEEEAADVEKGASLSPRFPQVLSALLEVRISHDDAKQGASVSDVFRILEQASRFKRVKLCGLMGMAGLNASPDETRRQFASLRVALEECRARFPELTSLRELSMGMSGDYEIAIEEGATIVRIGSTLYPSSY